MPPPSIDVPAFIAPGWLANKHVQSLGAALPLWAPPKRFRPDAAEFLRIPLPSGGALHAHAWWHARRAPAVLVVHGVGGSSSSRYVLRAAVSLYRAGWHAVRLDLRGAGASLPDARELYHAGLTEDPRVALDHVSRRVHVDGVAIVGFSLGGHVVLRLVGEIGDGPRGGLRAAVAVSAPFDLSSSSQAIERWRRRPYQSHVLRRLVVQAKAFAAAHPDRARYGVHDLDRLSTIRAFDTVVVAPMHGYGSAEDYYARASAGPLVRHIRVPTLVLHAEDDPLVPADSVRPWLRPGPFALPDAIEQGWTERGGHVGWFAGLSESSWVDTWAMRRARAFLAARL